MCLTNPPRSGHTKTQQSEEEKNRLQISLLYASVRCMMMKEEREQCTKEPVTCQAGCGGSGGGVEGAMGVRIDALNSGRKQKKAYGFGCFDHTALE